MPGLVPGIHVLYGIACGKNVDGRVKPGHDKEERPSEGQFGGSAILACPSLSRYRDPRP